MTVPIPVASEYLQAAQANLASIDTQVPGKLGDGISGNSPDMFIVIAECREDGSDNLC